LGHLKNTEETEFGDNHQNCWGASPKSNHNIFLRKFHHRTLNFRKRDWQILQKLVCPSSSSTRHCQECLMAAARQDERDKWHRLKEGQPCHPTPPRRGQPMESLLKLAEPKRQELGEKIAWRCFRRFEEMRDDYLMAELEEMDDNEVTL
jgi:hypothetical protein